jgi:ribulose-bisphosphate carboxylase large chain
VVLEVQLSQLRELTFQKQFLHDHRAGHGAITIPQTQRGYTAFVHKDFTRHWCQRHPCGTTSFSEMEVMLRTRT